MAALVAACDQRRSRASPPSDPNPQIQPGHWTALTPSPDTRHVYVSSSKGSDTNDGLSMERPKATIRAAVDVLRDGHPDWLHIRRGDEFEGGLPDWLRSGRSRREPMVVTTYGEAAQRPLLRCGSDSGVTVHTLPISDVAFVGLHLVADTYDGGDRQPYGVSMLELSKNVLVEDCRIERFFTNVRLQGPHADLRIRRSVIADAFTTTSSHAQGIYVDGVVSCLIEECVFDHNGWREEVAGAVPTIFRHNLYIQGNNRDVAVVGNLIARAGSHGLQMRSGGEVRGNVFLGNPIGMLVGSDIQNDGAVRAKVVGNVILDGRDISDSERRGWAAQFQCLQSAEIAYNVAAHRLRGTNPRSWLFDSTLGVGVQDVDFHDNVAFGWGAPLSLVSSRFGGLQVRSNDIQELGDSPVLHADKQELASALQFAGNRLFSMAPPDRWTLVGGEPMSLDLWRTVVADKASEAVRVAYPRPQMTIADYDRETGGGGTVEMLLQRARKQSQSDWNPMLAGTNVAAVFRANFGIVVPQ